MRHSSEASIYPSKAIASSLTPSIRVSISMALSFSTFPSPPSFSASFHFSRAAKNSLPLSISDSAAYSPAAQRARRSSPSTASPTSSTPYSPSQQPPTSPPPVQQVLKIIPPRVSIPENPDPILRVTELLLQCSSRIPLIIQITQ